MEAIAGEETIYAGEDNIYAVRGDRKDASAGDAPQAAVTTAVPACPARGGTLALPWLLPERVHD